MKLLIDSHDIVSILSEEKSSAIAKYIELMEIDDTGIASANEEVYEVANNERSSDKRNDNLRINIRELLQETATKYGIDIETIYSTSRIRKIVKVRQLVIYIALKNNLATSNELAKLLLVNPSQITRGYQAVVENKTMQNEALAIKTIFSC